jgi:hypothetical protein
MRTSSGYPATQSSQSIQGNVQALDLLIMHFLLATTPIRSIRANHLDDRVPWKTKDWWHFFMKIGIVSPYGRDGSGTGSHITLPTCRRCSAQLMERSLSKRSLRHMIRNQTQIP